MSENQILNNLDTARRVFDIESGAVARLSERLNGDFDKAIEMLFNCAGRVVVTGMGKPGIIGRKISATLASTGTPSIYLHPAEAVHGDLGMVVASDVLLAVSNSGETEEITRLLPLIKKIGTPVVSITGNPKSTLAKYSDAVLDVSVEKEACTLNLAPTASTTVMLAMGDALAVTILERRGFQPKDFAFYHPGGSLGKQFLKVGEVMRTAGDHPIVKETEAIKEVLLKITQARAGSATVVDQNGKCAGIFTDGDLRRSIAVDPRLLEKPVGQYMTRGPKSIQEDALAAEALRLIKDHGIDEVVVVNQKNEPVGLVDEKDLLGLT